MRWFTQSLWSYAGTQYIFVIRAMIIAIIIFAISDYVFLQFSLFSLNSDSSRYWNAYPLSGRDRKPTLQNQAYLGLKPAP